MTTVSSERLRVPLTPPQVVASTSVALWQPARDRGGSAVVLAPGAGTDLANALLLAVGRGLAKRGVPVAVFNFGYTEAGRRRPDVVAKLESAYRDIVAFARHRFGRDRPLVLGGRSMGGRIASHLAAQDDLCDGLVLLGYPLHLRQPAPRGVPAAVPEDLLRTGHWPAITVPTLFVQGDRDRLCDLDLFRRERSLRLVSSDSTLHVVAGADHGFAVRKRDGHTPSDVLDEVVGAVSEWVLQRDAVRSGRT